MRESSLHEILEVSLSARNTSTFSSHNVAPKDNSYCTFLWGSESRGGGALAVGANIEANSSGSRCAGITLRIYSSMD